jgi:hypothetical protein
MKNRKFAIALTVLLSLPTLFFLLFMFGEVLGGDLSGFGHLLQAAPFILLIILVWKWPFRKKRN